MPSILTPITTPSTTPSTIYATSGDLADYLGIEVADLPTGSSRLILRAQELIDAVTLKQIDTTDTAHLAAAKLATCAQVEWWNSVGEDRDVAGAVQQYSMGKFSITYGGSDNRISPAYLAPRAQRVLFTAGLLYAGVSLS
jgi:hypothetical protein